LLRARVCLDARLPVDVHAGVPGALAGLGVRDPGRLLPGRAAPAGRVEPAGPAADGPGPGGHRRPGRPGPGRPGRLGAAPVAGRTPGPGRGRPAAGGPRWLSDPASTRARAPPPSVRTPTRPPLPPPAPRVGPTARRPAYLAGRTLAAALLVAVEVAGVVLLVDRFGTIGGWPTAQGGVAVGVAL